MLRPAMLPPYYECRSIRDVYTDLAQRLGFGDKFAWKTDEDVVRYELEPCALNFDALTAKPEGSIYQEKDYTLRQGSFATPTGKIEIYSQAFADVGFDPLPTYLEPSKSPQGRRWAELGEEYPLVLATGTRDFYFNGAMLHNIKSLQTWSPFPKAELGPETAKKYNVANGDDVIVETDRGWVKMKAAVDARTMEASSSYPTAGRERPTATG